MPDNDFISSESLLLLLLLLLGMAATDLDLPSEVSKPLPLNSELAST